LSTPSDNKSLRGFVQAPEDVRVRPEIVILRVDIATEHGLFQFFGIFGRDIGLDFPLAVLLERFREQGFVAALVQVERDFGDMLLIKYRGGAFQLHPGTPERNLAVRGSREQGTGFGEYRHHVVGIVGELLFEVGEGGDGNGLDRRNRDCVRVARETGSQEKGADGTGGDTADEEEGFLQRVGISERFRV
jgi:hypothetical protein